MFNDRIYRLEDECIAEGVGLGGCGGYSFYMKEGCEVMRCGEKFEGLGEGIKVGGV